eukprot:TRINITY_DN108468_c0_g1_i1.p1 TRINITY_DN108468_c0_g1~~TRINITY_DN108468_c0_g1_i1.p1  ORF type:complete len:597 (-),score=84.55 TRINITY_DN108468_c0_g1_i1:41-1831(-)
MAGSDGDEVKKSKSDVERSTSSNVKSRKTTRYESHPAPESVWRLTIYHIQCDYRVQYFWAAMIILNFIAFIVEEQVDPDGDIYPLVWSITSITFTVLFSIELVLNMIAFCWKAFLTSYWHLFDFGVVMIGIWISFGFPIPSAFGQIRIVRTFRVLRLLDKIDSLHTILTSLFNALPYVLNAFIITVLVMSIYALMAVDLFSWAGCDITDQTYTTTSRGDCIGDEYFGDFFRSFYTLFQVMTGDSWSEAVARPLIWTFPDGNVWAMTTSLFFCSFQIVSSMVMLNVVVAVLTAKLGDVEAMKASLLDEEEKEQEDQKFIEVPKKWFEGVESSLHDIREQLTKINAPTIDLPNNSEENTDREGVDLSISPAPPVIDRMQMSEVREVLDNRLADIDDRLGRLADLVESKTPVEAPVQRIFPSLFQAPGQERQNQDTGRLAEQFSRFSKSMENSLNGSFSDYTRSLDEKFKQLADELKSSTRPAQDAPSTSGVQVSAEDLDALAAKAVARKSQEIEVRMGHFEGTLTDGLRAFTQESLKQHMQRSNQLEDSLTQRSKQLDSLLTGKLDEISKTLDFTLQTVRAERSDSRTVVPRAPRPPQ